MSKRREEWRGEQLSAIQTDSLLSNLSKKTSDIPKGARPNLDKLEKMSFHVLAGTYSKETLQTLKKTR